MWRGLAVLLLILIGFWPFPENQFSLTGHPDFTIGVHLLFVGQHTHFPRKGWGEHLRYARQMTGENGWVVQLIYSNDMNPEKWQRFLEDCATLQLRPVLRLATFETPDFWAAPPAGENGDYAEIADSWANFFAALEIQHPVWIVTGNEPNNGGEWGGTANPAEYANYFVAVASRLKALPQPLYIAPAALDNFLPHTHHLPFPGTKITMIDSATFFDGMFAAQPDLMQYVDFWASHVYPLGAFHRPPWEQEFRVDRLQGVESLPVINPPFQIYNRGTNSYRYEKWYLETVIGVDMPPVLITEYGYRHRESVDFQAADSGGAEVDSKTVAAYVEMAIFGNEGRYPDAPETGWIPLSHDPNVMGVVYFALAGEPVAWGHTNLLLVDKNGRVRGTYPVYDMLVNHD